MKQFIGMVVVGFETQANDMQGQIDQLTQDKEALQNKTQVIETALMEEKVENQVQMSIQMGQIAFASHGVAQAFEHDDHCRCSAADSSCPPNQKHHRVARSM